MLELTKCPACRARIAREIDIELPCRRCESDLRLLGRVYAQARAARREAQRHLGAGSLVEAERAARRAIALVNERETRETLAAVLVARERVSEALELLRPRAGIGRGGRR
jgi:hypothetical protein